MYCTCSSLTGLVVLFSSKCGNLSRDLTLHASNWDFVLFEGSYSNNTFAIIRLENLENQEKVHSGQSDCPLALQMESTLIEFMIIYPTLY